MKELKEVSNLPANSKLAKRLYRNSSLNRITPHTSLLASSPIRDSDCSILNRSGNSQLIASISLKKQKRDNDSERYLQFDKGKILVNQHHSYFESFHSLKHSNKKMNRKMFQKLEKLNHSPDNKILPDVFI